MHVCDFCGKDQTKVKRIIVAKDKAICDECILTCMSILLEETKYDFKEINFDNNLKTQEVI